MVDETVNSVEEVDEERCQAFSKEKKDLRAKIAALKHSVNKTDKKRKKEIVAEIEQLNAELSRLIQLSATEKAATSDAGAIINGGDVSLATDLSQPFSTDANGKENGQENGDCNPTVESGVARVSKAQKRRDKKAEKSKQRCQEIEEEERQYGNTSRSKEFEAISSQLRDRGLQIREIAADGDCLYNAILHQLELRDLKQLNLKSIRKQTADHMRQNVDEFLPFLTTSDDADAEIMTLQQYLHYCDKIERDTVWGGQSEIKAMVFVLQMPVEVIQGHSTPIVIGSEFLKEKPALVITYHRHAYRLGEHYNSTEPLCEDTKDF